MTNRNSLLLLVVLAGIGLAACDGKTIKKKKKETETVKATVHVHGLADVETKVKGIVEKFEGVSDLKLDIKSGKVESQISKSSGTTTEDIVKSLKKAGLHAHAGGH